MANPSRLLLLAALCPALAQEFVSAPSAAVVSKDPVRGLARLVEPPSIVGGLPAVAPHILPPPQRGSEQSGVTRPLAPGILDHARCETKPNGSSIWRLAIESTGVSGNRVRFVNFDLGPGRLWVHDAISSPAAPYTGLGPNHDGEFWSATVFGPLLVIEYEAERCDTAPPFTVAAVAHLWGDIAPSSKTLEARRNAAWCQVDITCRPEYAAPARSVARLLIETRAGWVVCTGALVNTKPYSGNPYLLTANHCVSTAQEARSLEAIWNYQTAACGASPPASYGAQRSRGMELLATSGIGQGDFSLVRLDSVANIPNLEFAGWTTQEPGIGDQLVGVHHPTAVSDHKRVSIGVRSTDRTVSVEGQTAPASRYYSVQWNIGRTEQGSSGSPLLRQDATGGWQVVGTLTYGPASDRYGACEINPFLAGYGRFSTAYPQLSAFLGTTAPGPNERFVSLLYSSFFGRTPAPLEVTLHANRLASGVTREQIAAEFLTSVEFQNTGRAIAALYVGLLARDPDFAGWVYQRTSVTRGLVSLSGLAGAFLTTPEFRLKYGSPSDAEFVRIAYRQILLREATAAEVEFQVANALSRGVTRGQFAGNLLATPEFRVGTAPRLTAWLLYAAILQRDPLSSERDGAGSQIASGLPLTASIAALLSTSEFAALMH